MATTLNAEAVKFSTAMLLQSPLTLAACGARVWAADAAALKRSSAHRRLFSKYAAEADHVALVALDWWEDTVNAQHVEGRSPKEAVRAAWECRPAGPASFPGVVALIRDYWLACDELNREVPDDERVPPWIFLLQWLVEGEHPNAVSVLASMPYWPIGLDREGNWV